MDEGPGPGRRVGDRFGHRGGFLLIALGEHEHSFPQEAEPRNVVVEFQRLQFFEHARRVSRQQRFQIAVFR